MSRYTSMGTVNVQWSWTTKNAKVKVFFIPDGDHSVRCDGHLYAVFVRDRAGSTKPARVSKCDTKKVVCIRFKRLGKSVSAGIYDTLTHAATKQCKVKIKVKKGKKRLKLVGITIPAP